MQCLPDNLRDRHYYRPTDQGFEKRLQEKLTAIEDWRRKYAESKQS